MSELDAIFEEFPETETKEKEKKKKLGPKPKAKPKTKPKAKPKAKPEPEVEELAEEEFDLEEEIVEPEKAEESIIDEVVAEASMVEDPEQEAVLVEAMEDESTDEWDYTEDETSFKVVLMLYGLKGDGKTSSALSRVLLNETIAAVSLDRKTAPVKSNMYKNNKNIHVFNGVKYMDYGSSEAWLESSEKTFRFIQSLLENKIAKLEPDWILFDASEKLTQIAEMTMRYRNGLQPVQGIANRNLWKERKLYIRQLHFRALEIAKKGLIYTSFTGVHEVVAEGETVTRQEVPRWIDAIMEETDIVIKCTSERDEEGKHYLIYVESSKYDQMLQTGEVIDVTNSPLPLQAM